MAAVLFATVGVDLMAGGPRPVEALTLVTADRVISGPVHACGGSILRVEASDAVAVFASGVDAVGCALAVRSEVAERNRARAHGSQPVRARFFVHVVPDDVAAGVTESTLQHAAAVAQLTPAGRVFVSKPVYLESRGANLFAFVPLGQERFSGLPEPVDVFEAMPAMKRGWVLPADRRPASELRTSPTVPRAAVRPGNNSKPVAMPCRPVVPTTWTGWAGTLILATAGFALRRLVLALLAPLQLVNYVAGVVGVFMFGLTGSESRAVLGGLLLPVALPIAAVVYSLAESRPVLARWSIFWTGMALTSVGGSVLTNTDPASLASILRMGLMELLGMFGAGASAGWVARSALLCGCVLMAAAGAAGLQVKPDEDAASTRIAA